MRRIVWCRVAGAAAAALALLAGADPAHAQDRGSRMDGGHNPPLLVASGEALELRYDVICPGTPCENVAGTAYVRGAGDRGFRALPLLQGGPERRHLLYAAVPADVLRHGFDYYATFQDARRGLSLRLPSGGDAAPQHVWVFEPGDAHLVALRGHHFGATRRPDESLLRAEWGSGKNQLGLDAGFDMATLGPSSFDFAPDGSLVVLDSVNKRAVRVSSTGTSLVPLQISGAPADLAVEFDGSLHVLDNGVQSVLRVFSPEGQLLASGPLAERNADAIRSGPGGVAVRQYPSDAWMPATHDFGASLLSVQDQVRRARPGRAVEAGAAGVADDGGAVELVVKATYAEVRVALVSGERVLRSWRVVNDARPALNIGEVQLAEMLDGELLLVLRVWSENTRDFSTQADFRVLRLAEFAVLDFAVDTAEWADMSSVSRFRLGPGGLYQMRSSPAGAEVVRFDLDGK